MKNKWPSPAEHGQQICVRSNSAPDSNWPHRTYPIHLWWKMKTCRWSRHLFRFGNQSSWVHIGIIGKSMNCIDVYVRRNRLPLLRPLIMMKPHQQNTTVFWFNCAPRHNSTYKSYWNTCSTNKSSPTHQKTKTSGKLQRGRVRVIPPRRYGRSLHTEVHSSFAMRN